MSTGSSTAKRGITKGEKKCCLSPVLLRVMTAPMFISEPVAGRVSTAPRGMAEATSPPTVSRMCQGSLARS
ncbi:hypothetical protein D3C85_1547830 [compost metagenome]